MSDADESAISVTESTELSLDELYTVKNNKTLSEDLNVMGKTDDLVTNININLDDILSCEAEIDTTVSLKNDKTLPNKDSEDVNVNLIKEDNFQCEMDITEDDAISERDNSKINTSHVNAISSSEVEVDSNLSIENDKKLPNKDSEDVNVNVIKEDNFQCEMDITEDDVISETVNSKINTSNVNDISSNEAELDSNLSLGNDKKIITTDSAECNVIKEDNNSECKMDISINIETSKTTMDSILSLGNDQDSGVIEDDTNDKFDVNIKDDTVSDKVQSASPENADTSMSLPLESEQDSGVIEDVPNNELNLVMEQDIEPEKNQTVDLAANNAVSLTPMEDELNLIRDIIDDSSEDEAILSHQTGAADESEPEDPRSSKDNERENKPRSSSKDLTLPYFKLPKPDLDEFLAETEKNLQISLPTSETTLSKEESSSFRTKPKKSTGLTFLPKETRKGFFDPKKTFSANDGPKDGFITIDLDFDYSKLSNKDSFKKKVQIAEIDDDTSCKTVKNEYEKVVSSLNKDETDLPGIKRLALKEFLKKQIDQKRYEAFCHSKYLNKEDEEMEEAFNEEEEEVVITDDEDSAEEEEEATVIFENLNKKDDTGSNGEDGDVSEKEPGDEGVLNDEESGNESDDDFIGLRKAKKKILVLEEEEDEDFPNEDKSSLEMENTSTFKLKSTQGIGNGIESEDDDDEDMNDVRDSEKSKNSQPAFREASGDFQLQEKSNGLSQISSSMPSYQPGGGFNQDIILEDSSDSGASLPSLQQLQEDANQNSQALIMRYQSEENVLRKSLSNSVLESDTVVQKSILSPKIDNIHHIRLDDLPISQTDNDSDIFATNELADVCSGAFNGGDSEESTEEVIVSQTEAENSTPSLRRLEDVLKYPSKEKYDEPEPEPEPEEKITDFFDVEAELSGEDDGVDEKDEDSEDDNLVLHPSDEEDLPEDEVLREEIADLHMKRLMNDDAEYLREIQEQFLDDGELNTDGAGRSRRFAWLKNDTDIAPAGNNSDSDSDADVADEMFSSLNEEKAKWRQEHKEDENEDITEELNSSVNSRKSFLKVNIIGKPKFSQEEVKVKRLSGKRPRGSFLNLDDSSASQVLKKLKASEDNVGGSRTTKHFVFRNELADPGATGKENSVKSVLTDSSGVSESPKMCSIFNKI